MVMVMLLVLTESYPGGYSDSGKKATEAGTAVVAATNCKPYVACDNVTMPEKLTTIFLRNTYVLYDTSLPQ